MKIHNCHSHIFTIDAVPLDFLPFRLTQIAQTRPGNWLISALLKAAYPFSSRDMLDRFGQFVAMAGSRNQDEIFQNIRRFYPPDSVTVVLSMDMAYMGAGRVVQPFEKQLEELALIKKVYGPLIRPFVCVDPRRPGFFDLAKRAIEEFDFSGIKIYPPLGYFPYDPRLDPLWSYAVENRIPVVTHVSKEGIHYQKKVTREMLAPSRLSAEIHDQYKREPYYLFSHPANYEVLGREYPELKLLLSHFGGIQEWESFLSEPPLRQLEMERDSSNWFVVVKELVEKYANFYTDISYTLNERKYFSVLKVILQLPEIRDKILYGSDYYMVHKAGTEKTFSFDLRAFLGEEDYARIAETNPIRFLS